MNEELIEQENKLYESTKDFGRIQFIREIIKLQQENAQLKIEKEQAIKSISHYVYERDVLQQQLKDKDEKISEVKELLKNPSTIDYEMYGLEYSRDIVDIKLLLEILESNKED